MHGGFDPMQAVVRDIPFVARRSALGRAAARRVLGLAAGQRVVLPSFGAYGLALPYAELATSRSFTLLFPPGSESGSKVGSEVTRLRYEDLVAAADVVVSKPGYGIVSECIANGAALLYAMRGGFVEEALLVAEMPPVLRCRSLSQEDLRAGRWERAIQALMDQPPPPERPDVSGADAAAGHILEAADGHT
jgi:L-arabinokinase